MMLVNPGDGLGERVSVSGDSECSRGACINALRMQPLAGADDVDISN